MAGSDAGSHIWCDIVGDGEYNLLICEAISGHVVGHKRLNSKDRKITSLFKELHANFLWKALFYGGIMVFPVTIHK